MCKKCRKEIPNGSLYCNFCGKKQTERNNRRASGRGSIVKTQNGTYRLIVNRYYQGIRYRKVKSGFVKKKDAEEYADTLLAQLNAEIGSIGNGKALIRYDLKKLHEVWMESETYQKLSETKKTHYRTAWRRMHATDDIKISELKLSQMQEVLRNSGLNYYPQKDMKMLYSHLYKYAIKHELVSVNRAALLELPEQPNANRTPWELGEVQKWWGAYRGGDPVARIILIMIHTGMRTGEMWAQDVDQIHLDEQYMIGGIKTEIGKNRTIPLASPIVPLVAESMKEARRGLMPWRTENEFYDKYAETVERIGVRPLDPYSCRHTTATVLGELGVAPSVIQSIMGHASYEMTLHYTHISKDAQIEAVEALAHSSSRAAK